jgi:hypothetical protein
MFKKNIKRREKKDQRNKQIERKRWEIEKY